MFTLINQSSNGEEKMRNKVKEPYFNIAKKMTSLSNLKNFEYKYSNQHLLYSKKEIHRFRMKYVCNHFLFLLDIIKRDFKECSNIPNGCHLCSNYDSNNPSS